MPRNHLATASDAWLTIGQLAQRAGVATSALRFYEQRGLIAAARSSGGHRLYPRHVLRRIGFIHAAQSLGISLAEIHASLSTLPDGRTPSKRDWQVLARSWRPLIDARIEALQKLRGKLDACIGCGCLSISNCALYNPGDQAAERGSGAVFMPILATPEEGGLS